MNAANMYVEQNLTNDKDLEGIDNGEVVISIVHEHEFPSYRSDIAALRHFAATASSKSKNRWNRRTIAIESYFCCRIQTSIFCFLFVSNVYC